MKIKSNNGSFEPCPEYTGKAVCVDITPLRKQQSAYGERDVFKVVFEVDLPREDGTRFCVWSNNFTPSLNEKANLRKFLRSWFGRDLTKQELEEFDTESLIGKPAQLVVVHQHKDGEVFANIAACTPDKSGAPLRPCGKFARKGQANETPAPAEKPEEAGSTYRPAEGGADEASEFSKVKVHVGKCKGLELRELAPEQIQALITHWVPTMAKPGTKTTADDRRLLGALAWWEQEQAVPAY